MVDHPADGIDAAHAGAGLHALGVQAGLLRRTVAVEDAFRPAADVRISEVTLAADAGQAALLPLALRVGSAMQLGAAGLWRWHYHRLRGALLVGVSKESRGTGTHRVVLVHVADGVASARSRAGIQAALAQAGAVKRTV